MILKREIELLAALVVIVSVLSIVLFGLALPYALLEAYGLKVKKPILLMQLVFLAIFSACMLVWWRVRYRQTSEDIETFRQEIEWRKSMVATKVNMMLLKGRITVDTNERKDDYFCSKWGRELMPLPTGDCCCSYYGNHEKREGRYNRKWI